MHIMDEEIYLTMEIVEMVLIFAIKNNISDVLSFIAESESLISVKE